MEIAVESEIFSTSKNRGRCGRASGISAGAGAFPGSDAKALASSCPRLAG